MYSEIINSNCFYWSVSNIIILILWIYLLAYILVIGIAINSGQYNIKEEITKEIE